MKAPLLVIKNNHADDCGEPPVIAESDYVGYFKNAFGEQWLFTFDRQAQTGTLFGGDIGWDEPIVVEDGICDSVVLSPAEAQWLAACWTAISA
jgi:hypothetical protein